MKRTIKQRVEEMRLLAGLRESEADLLNICSQLVADVLDLEDDVPYYPELHIGDDVGIESFDERLKKVQRLLKQISKEDLGSKSTQDWLAEKIQILKGVRLRLIKEFGHGSRGRKAMDDFVRAQKELRDSVKVLRDITKSAAEL